MDRQFRGAHYAARPIWWCAEGVKTITSGFSIFFCEALPFIQPSWKAIRSGGIRVVGETTGLHMAAWRFLQPWGQKAGKDTELYRSTSVVPQPPFPPSAWKLGLPPLLMGTSGVTTHTEDTFKSSHHKYPGEGGSWGQPEHAATAKRTEYSPAGKTFRQSKPQDPGH